MVVILYGRVHMHAIGSADETYRHVGVRPYPPFMGTDIRALAAGGVLVLVLGALVAATSNGVAGFGVDPADTAQGERQDGDPGRDGGRGSGNDGGGESQPDLPDRDPGEAAPWLRTLALVLLALLLGAGVLVIFATFRIGLRRRRLKGGQVPHTIGGLYVEGEPPAPEESLHEVLEQRLVSLGEGTPRNAIVAAWVRLEDFARAHGLASHESDTPSEFVARTLATYDLDADAIQRLADLYREARFSEHPLTEAHRAEARTCLQRLVSRVVAP